MAVEFPSRPEKGAAGGRVAVCVFDELSRNPRQQAVSSQTTTATDSPAMSVCSPFFHRGRGLSIWQRYVPGNGQGAAEARLNFLRGGACKSGRCPRLV